MTKPLAGIRVLEVDNWGFAPSAGVVLADWGADVVKVEPPGRGDPLRAIFGALNWGPGAMFNFMYEQWNRGKRSIALDLATPDGSAIPIEERNADEVRRGFGKLTAPEGADVYSPAFDVTPHDLITAIITEHGVHHPPFASALKQVKP